LVIFNKKKIKPLIKVLVSEQSKEGYETLIKLQNQGITYHSTKSETFEKSVKFIRNNSIKPYLKVLSICLVSNDNKVKSDFYIKFFKQAKHQTFLAHNYGIYGFVLPYTKIGENIEFGDYMLHNLPETFELPFCICVNLDSFWAANTNQGTFIKKINGAFNDKRYIKINNTPVLIICIKTLSQNRIQSIKLIENSLKDRGVFPIFIPIFDLLALKKNCASQIIKDSIENSPHLYYEQIANESVISSSAKFPTILCGNQKTILDDKQAVYIRSTPNKYKQWLTNKALITAQNGTNEEMFIIINGLGSCTKGNLLNKDSEFGFAYLQKTYEVIRSLNNKKLDLVKQQTNFCKNNETAIIVHLFYFEMWEEILTYLNNIPFSFDLFISINVDLESNKICELIARFPDVNILISDNRGRDILPFLHFFKKIYPLNYKLICKIHTKKSPHMENGDFWRSALFNSLLGSQNQIIKITQALNKVKIGMVIPKGYALKYKKWKGSNHKTVVEFAKKNKISFTSKFLFPAGSMFWCKPSSIKQLAFLEKPDKFPIDNGAIDGTLAHAYERIFGLLCKKNNYEIVEL